MGLSPCPQLAANLSFVEHLVSQSIEHPTYVPSGHPSFSSCNFTLPDANLHLLPPKILVLGSSSHVTFCRTILLGVGFPSDCMHPNCCGDQEPVSTSHNVEHSLLIRPIVGKFPISIILILCPPMVGLLALITSIHSIPLCFLSTQSVKTLSLRSYCFSRFRFLSNTLLSLKSTYTSKWLEAFFSALSPVLLWPPSLRVGVTRRRPPCTPSRLPPSVPRR